jgi:NADH:ubiquinone oxidoreductase subunit E
VRAASNEHENHVRTEIASLIYVVYAMLIELNASVAVVASNLQTRGGRICTARAYAQGQEKRKSRVSLAVCETAMCQAVDQKKWGGHRRVHFQPRSYRIR